MTGTSQYPQFPVVILLGALFLHENAKVVISSIVIEVAGGNYAVVCECLRRILICTHCLLHFAD